MYQAIVTFYRHAPDLKKNFGFAKLPDGRSVYINGYRQLYAYCNGSDNPQFGAGKFREPMINDMIMCDIADGEKGIYATQWVFKHEYDEAIKLIEGRSTYRFYKQLGPKKVSRLLPQGWQKAILIWEGCNLADLRVSYPKQSYKVRDTDDYRCWFEVLDKETGEWVATDDPR